MQALHTLAIPLTGALLAGAAHADPVRTYFGTADSRGIYTSLFDTGTGKLSTPVLAIELKAAGFVAIHPGGRFLYATTAGPSRDQGAVAAMRMEPDGGLTLLNTQPSGGRNPCHVSIDATGRCLLVANYGGGTVAALPIREDGSLAPAASVHQHEGSGPHPRRQEGPHPHSINPDPANRFAYVPDLGLDQVVIYRLDPEAATLTPAGTAPVPNPGAGPRHMKFSRDGEYAYVVSEMGVEIAVFRADPETGALKHVAGSPNLPDPADREGLSCSEILIHPNGRFVYAGNRDVSNQGRDSITICRTAADGGFRVLKTVPSEVAIPRHFNIDPSGRWMLVGGQKSHDIAIFRVDGETGDLTFTGDRIPFEGGPICIAFSRPRPSRILKAANPLETAPGGNRRSRPLMKAWSTTEPARPLTATPVSRSVGEA